MQGNSLSLPKAGTGWLKTIDMNDRISSIKFPSDSEGWKVIVYQHANLRGKSLTLTKSIADLQTKNFNNTISSVQIIPPKKRVPKDFVISNMRASTQKEVDEWNRVVREMQGISAIDPVSGKSIYNFPAEKDEWRINIPDYIDDIPLVPDEINSNINNWIPLSSEKQTICGVLDRFGVFDGGESLGESIFDDSEMDWNLFIIPNDEFSFLIEDALKYKGGKGIYCQEDKWHTCGNNKVPCLEAEITPDESFYENPWFPKSTKVSPLEGREVCFYGPWVRECLHAHRPEIHPSEMIWWRESNDYFMMFVQDDSNRFDSRDNFELKGSVPSDWKPWAAPPLTAQFRIAFEVKPNEHALPIPGIKPQQMVIRELHSRFVVTENDKKAKADSDDGKNHKLVYKGRVLLSVLEAFENESNLGVQFVDVSKRGNGVIQGYVQLTTKIGGADIRGDEGYHVLKASKEAYSAETANVTFYTTHNFQGKQLKLALGDYPKLERNFDDAISSVKVNRGQYTITVCEHPNFKGKCLDLTKTHTDLQNFNFGDKISSIKNKKEFQKGA